MKNIARTVSISDSEMKNLQIGKVTISIKNEQKQKIYGKKYSSCNQDFNGKN